jgi:outer membrane protein TolC
LAALDAAGIAYKQTVLQGLQEVQDNLVAAYQLQLQSQAQAQALQAAQRNLSISEAQYAAGTVSYLNVVTAQTAALSAERSLLDIQSRRVLAATQLMKNLGGRLSKSFVAGRENKRRVSSHGRQCKGNGFDTGLLDALPHFHAAQSLLHGQG